MSLSNIQSQIDSIKEKMTDNEYLELCNSMKDLHNKKKESNIYEVKLFIQTHDKDENTIRTFYKLTTFNIRFAEGINVEKLQDEIKKEGGTTLESEYHFKKNEYNVIKYTSFIIKDEEEEKIEICIEDKSFGCVSIKLIE